MDVLIAAVMGRAPRGPADELVRAYLRRTQPFFRVEAPVFRTEGALLAALDGARGRSAPGAAGGGRGKPAALLLDRTGRPVSSEELAELLRRHRDGGTQGVVLAVGPADGWSAAARERVPEALSLGAITLPHELARVVLAEQVYRAGTILAGHPYHAGH